MVLGDSASIGLGPGIVSGEIGVAADIVSLAVSAHQRQPERISRGVVGHETVPGLEIEQPGILQERRSSRRCAIENDTVGMCGPQP